MFVSALEYTGLWTSPFIHRGCDVNYLSQLGMSIDCRGFLWRYAMSRRALSHWEVCSGIIQKEESTVHFIVFSNWGYQYGDDWIKCTDRRDCVRHWVHNGFWFIHSCGVLRQSWGRTKYNANNWGSRLLRLVQATSHSENDSGVQDESASTNKSRYPAVISLHSILSKFTWY